MDHLEDPLGFEVGYLLPLLLHPLRKDPQKLMGRLWVDGLRSILRIRIDEEFRFLEREFIENIGNTNTYTLQFTDRSEVNFRLTRMTSLHVFSEIQRIPESFAAAIADYEFFLCMLFSKEMLAKLSSVSKLEPTFFTSIRLPWHPTFMFSELVLF